MAEFESLTDPRGKKVAAALRLSDEARGPFSISLWGISPGSGSLLVLD
ncbi:hypothetical protein [Streptomyces gilvus]|nr:hypothetical protein [Streptomyces sp. CME 23]MCH5677905.1 hypothetical protein [Streptomyces sp. CME 23]